MIFSINHNNFPLTTSYQRIYTTDRKSTIAFSNDEDPGSNVIISISLTPSDEKIFCILYPQYTFILTFPKGITIYAKSNINNPKYQFVITE